MLHSLFFQCRHKQIEMIRRRDRILSRPQEHSLHDDRASIVTSATEEPVSASIKTLQARQVEVVEIDQHRVVDRVVEFVSSSILVRALSRAGSAASVLTCIVGGGALSLYRFTDSDFFAVSDSNVLMLLCSPKFASPDEFQALLEHTLSVRCCIAPKLMSFIHLDAATMNRIWQAVADIAFRRRSATIEVDTRDVIEPLDIQLDVESTRVSAAHSHLTSAVDDLVRSLFENRGAHAMTAAINNVKVTLASHSTSGRLAGAVSLVHVVEALVGCLASCSTTSVALVKGDVCHCILTAGSSLAWNNMLMVADLAKSQCIASNVLHISTRETPQADVSLAITASVALLSCAPEDLLLKTAQFLQPTRVISESLRLLCHAEFAVEMMENVVCRGAEIYYDVVAKQIMAIVGDEVPMDQQQDVTCAQGASECVWSGAAVVLSTAIKVVDYHIAEGNEAWDQDLYALVRTITTLIKRMCYVLCSLEVQAESSQPLSLLQRWLTAFTSVFRRAAMWCVMIQSAKDNSQLSRELFEAAISFLMTKSLVAPFDGTSHSKLGLISHQWLVRLSIAAGPAAHDLVIHVLDVFYRMHLSRNKAKRVLLWNEVGTAIEGLVASIPSPSPMLRMWQSVATVVDAFRIYSADNHNVAAQRVIVSHVARVAALREETFHDPVLGADAYLKEKSWVGRWEKFDVLTPLDVVLPALSNANDHASASRTYLTRFGVSAQDLHVVGPPFMYVWESLKNDLTARRDRSLAVQCLELSDLLRGSGAPIAPCVVLAACGVAKLALLETKLREETSATLQVVRTFASHVHCWLDLQLALHLASVPERMTPANFTSERSQAEGLVGRHLPQAVRLGVQNKAQGKLSIIDRIALSYGEP